MRHIWSITAAILLTGSSVHPASVQSQPVAPTNAAINRHVSYIFESFEVLGGSSTQGFGVNDLGQVVGTFYNPATPRGFLLDSGIFTTIDAPGARATFATGINNAGQVVGQADTRSFLKDGSTIVLFDIAGAQSTSANGINAAGSIVGTYADPFGRNHGLLESQLVVEIQ